MFDIDTCNLIAKENQQQREWEQSERNRIRKIQNPKRRQLAWNSLSPKLPEDNMVY